MLPIKITPMRWFAVLLVIAWVLILTLPQPNPRILAVYHLSATTYRVLIYSLFVLESIVWYGSFLALAKMREYSKYLKGSKEYKAFIEITSGIGVLAFGLIVTTIISGIFNHITASHVGFFKASTIVNNYLSMLVAVMAFTLMSSGTYWLASSTKAKTNLKIIWLFGAVFIALAVFFEHTTLRSNAHGRNPYYLGTYLLLLTIIIPYIYAWFVGILSAYSLLIYSINVRGKLYKKALWLLALGTAIVVAADVALQFLTGVFGYETTLSFNAVLVALYILLIIFAVGFGVMAWGAKKLKKIEEV